ncbi:MAG: MMPL family transporter [Angustibacter sp.]
MSTVQITTRAQPPHDTEPSRPGLLERYGAGIASRPRLVLALFVVIVAAMGVLGSGVFPRLGSGGFDVPGSESDRARTVLADRFDSRDPIVVIALEGTDGVDAERTATAAQDVVRQLSGVDGVGDVVSYWTSGRLEALRGNDGRTGQIIVGTDETAADPASAEKVGAAVVERARVLDAANPDVRAFIGGSQAINEAINEQITEDLKVAEIISIPIQFVLLLVVFGTLVAAGLPFLVALGSIIGSFFVLWLISLTTDVSVFALNLVTGLGLGLGIDYALLVVNRFREELDRAETAGTDDEVRRAVARTVATAGRTVLFSGTTVAVVMASLMFFPQYFLKSFGYAGMAATLLAMLAAVSALPAVLALAGRRINRLRVLRRDLTPRDQGGWNRLARAVMRRPVAVTLVTVAGLGVLAAPVLGASFSSPDQRILPASSPVAMASSVLQDRFDGQAGSPVDIVLTAAAGRPDAVRLYAERLSTLPGVTSVTTAGAVFAAGRQVANPQPGGFTAGDDARVRVLSDLAPRTTDGRDLVAAVRDVPAPGNGRLVGGAAAEFTDSQAGIVDSGRWALVWIGVATLVLLFLFTGSLLLPVKAVLLNVLGLAATLGVLVWGFQDGHLRWLVGDFTVTGQVDTSMSVLIAVTVFALSMDYEVFLVSRIAEEHRQGSNTQDSVALGLQRSGLIITAAALLLGIVFAAFVTSQVTTIKMLGFGVAFAILLDALVIRALLVPALMRLAGRWNWWAPRPLVWLHRRVGLRED